MNTPRMLDVHGSPLYQWDRNRQLRIDSVDIDSDFVIHCCHADDSTSLVVTPIIEGDVILVNIPNIVLQKSGFIRVYVVVAGDTIYDRSFYVMARPRPNDYVYTETDVLNYTYLENSKLDKNQGAGNSGKLLFVGKDGKVSVLTLGDGLEIIDNVLCVTSSVVVAEFQLTDEEGNTLTDNDNNVLTI